MNASNALAFMIMGSLMELLPRAFPSWFPPTGAGEASCRALWLAVMGAVQISLGLGFIAMAHAYPFAHRLVARVPSRDTAAVPLPGSRGVTVR